MGSFSVTFPVGYFFFFLCQRASSLHCNLFPHGGFRDSASGRKVERNSEGYIILSSPSFLCTNPRFFFSFKCHLIVSGILIAKRSEWDAVPVMTNVAAKVTRRRSQGTWDGRAAEASCGLVIMGLRSVGANTPLTMSQQPDSSGTGGHLRPKLLCIQRLLTQA